MKTKILFILIFLNISLYAQTLYDILVEQGLDISKKEFNFAIYNLTGVKKKDTNDFTGSILDTKTDKKTNHQNVFEAKNGFTKLCNTLTYKELSTSMNRNQTISEKIKREEQACIALGQMYYEGIGVRQNKEKALKLYHKACEAGVCYKLNSILKDYYKQNTQVYNILLRNLYEISCKNGDSNACKLLGNKQNTVNSAIPFYTKACNSNIVDGEACYKLAKITLFNKKEILPAISLYDKACNNKIKDACLDLINIYEDGKYKGYDLSIAKEYAGKACDNNSQKGCLKYKELNKKGY